MIDLARHLRQVMLAEIGEAGQARLAGAVVPVDGDGLAHEVAVRYALGAGARVAGGAIDRAELVPAWIEGAAAGDVLAGSRAALAALRAAAREGRA